MHTRRVGRLSGTTAQRLLDGGDGPPPLPQLLAAATAPATAAELRGEPTVRAAFRSTTHTVSLFDDLPRRSSVRITTSIMIAKVVAAIALTAGTAGTVALATTSTPTAPHTRTTSEFGTTDGAAPSSPVLATPMPTGAALAGPGGTTDAADEPDRSDGAGTAARTTPEAGARQATGRCRAASNVGATDHPGKAAESPAFADLSCTGPDAAADAGTGTRPEDRATVVPGNPEKKTGKPDDTGRPADDTQDEDEDEDAAKPGKAVGRTDDADRGRSGENSQDS